jgi:malate dehydrogenase (oxaloacetate-decarboxylating)
MQGDSNMRRKAIPLLALPMRHFDRKEAGCHETKARGMAVLASPLLNKGTAFTIEERKALGLTGLLPPAISTLDAQADGAYIQYQRLPDALSKNIYLTALRDRNDVLFFRVLSDHLREMIPIVNDRTVGMAMEQYHHECRRPRGVYLSIDLSSVLLCRTGPQPLYRSRRKGPRSYYLDALRGKGPVTGRVCSQGSPVLRSR